MDTYVLVPEKPKLRKADPSNRPGCKTIRAPRPSESTPALLLTVCRNVTMAQFAQQLQSIAPVYFHYPVRDATAIAGSWDFTFTFSRLPPELEEPGGGIQTTDPAPRGSRATASSDPVTPRRVLPSAEWWWMHRAVCQLGMYPSASLHDRRKIPRLSPTNRENSR